MTGAVKRYKATICANLRKKNSYAGRGPQSREEELELLEKQYETMAPKIIGKSFCYNHEMEDEVGKIVASERGANGEWDIEIEIDGRTMSGRRAQGWIETGHCRGVSLSHRPGNGRRKDTPVESSYCFEGARPGTIIHSVYDSKLGKYIPLNQQTHTIAASSDGSDKEFILNINEDDNDDKMDASQDAAADAAAAAAAVASGASQGPESAEQKQQEQKQPDQTVDPEEEEEEKDESVSQSKKKKPEAEEESSSDDLDLQTIDRLRKSLESSSNLSKKDRIALQNTIAVAALKHSKAQSRIEEMATKLREYEQKELAAREAKLAEERAELERETERHRKIIGDFYRSNAGNPLAERAIKACKEKSTTLEMLEVYSQSCVLASAATNGNDVARMSPTIAAEWKKHLAEREAAKRNKSKPIKAAKEPAVAAPAKSSAVTKKKKIEASAMDTSDDDNNEDDDDSYGGMVLASASGRRYILGEPLPYPPQYVEDSQGLIRASARPSDRDLRRMTDYQRRDALKKASETFVPWTKGSGAYWDMHDFPDQIKEGMARLWCEYPGGTGFKGNQATNYRPADYISASTIKAYSQNLNPMQRDSDMNDLSDWTKLMLTASKKKGGILPA
jgi:hypothetical protein